MLPNWQTSIAVSVLLLSTLIIVILFILSWRQRTLRRASSFAFLVAAIGIWLAFYTLELAVPSLENKILTAQIQYIGIPAVSLGWFVFALSYAGFDHWFGRRRLIFFSIIPLTTTLLAFTNSWHRLIWAEITLNNNGPFSTFSATYGSAWYVHFVYSYALLIIGSATLVFAFWKSSTTDRWQSLALLGGALFPWIGNILFLSESNPIPQLDLTPFTFTLSAVSIGFGVLGLRLIDMVPVARKNVLDSMNEMMIVLDNHNRITDANRAARQFLPSTDRGIIGQDVMLLLKDWPSLSKIETDEDIRVPVGNLDRFFNLRINPIYRRKRRDKGVENRVIGRMILLSDITYAKQAEEAIAMSRIKTEFFAKVGHELRTPLNGILGLTEMLEYGVYGEMSEEQMGVTTQILDRTRFLSKLVNDLLQQSQMESHAFTLQLSSFSPEELLNKLAETLISSADAKGLYLKTNVASGVPKALVGDPIRLFQILINLVENGLKFTEKGGISVSIYQPDTDHWALRVQDTGIGIPAEWQSRIFEAFRQADYSVMRENNGVGLGLSIVNELTTLMNGEVELHSEENQGSTFIVQLPILTSDAIPASIADKVDNESS